MESFGVSNATTALCTGFFSSALDTEPVTFDDCAMELNVANNPVTSRNSCFINGSFWVGLQLEKQK